jgi:hypothetical protein
MRLGRSDRFLNILHRMTGKILGDLAAKNVRQLLVVALAKVAESARGGDDDEIRNLAIEHPFVEQTDIPPGETVFRGLAFIRIGSRRTPFLRFRIRFRRRQRGAGLITGIAKQIELFSVGDGHDCSLG